MNILLVIGEMNNGGAETHVFSLACALLNRGHSVCVASAGGRLARRLCREGIQHVTLPLNSKAPLRLIMCRIGLKKLVRSGRFHIVHAHSRISAFIASRICEKLDVCFVTTIHANYRENRILHSLSRWGNGVIAVSHDLAFYLKKHCTDILSENITVIPNGIDVDSFAGIRRTKDGVFRIVFLSRLDKDCSLAARMLIDIAPRLYGRHANVEIIIGGGGSEHRRIEQLAAMQNHRMGREIIRAVGRVENVAEIMGGADVFVGVSRAALEAMSCGVPVILGGNEGFMGVLDGELLNRGAETNFCCRDCPTLTRDGLLSAIEQIMFMSYEERGELGERLRKYVSVHHSIERICSDTENFYRKTMKKAPAGKGGVVLCGYYGYGNMGDELLLKSSVARATKIYKATPICALTARGKRDGRKFCVSCVRRSDLFAVLRTVKCCQALIFGGGTLLQNSTSRRSLWYYLFILKYAQSLGKRVELWGNGIGVINGRWNRRQTARLISNCDYVGLRDRESAVAVGELMDEFGLYAPKVVMEDDLALSEQSADMKYRDCSYVEARIGISNTEKIVVVAVRGSENKGYIKAIEKWIRSLSVKGVKPVFIAMYPSEDMKLCKRLSRDCGGVMAYPVGATEVMALMRRSVLVCGMRYHSLALAYMSGVPFIGFGGEGKVQSFCRSHGGIYYTDIE